jgi:uncharacterized membrane protein YebE (DUF533 family)
MSFGNIIEQVLRQGMGGQSRARLEHSVGPQGLGGVPGLGELLGAVLGGQASGRSAGGGGLGDVFGGNPSGRASTGGLEDLLGGVLGGATRGAGGAGGGLGDLLGGVLGGGRAQRSGSGSRSGAGMAILATIAMAALKNWSQSRGSAMGLTGAASSIAPGEMDAMTAPETEQLVLLAMISAAKADGAVDEAEIERIVGQIDDDGVSPAEKEFLLAELRKPLDLRGLVDAVPSAAVAAQVYGASLFVIKVDTEAEADYLQQLAGALGLDAGTVTRLHELTGAPAV